MLRTIWYRIRFFFSLGGVVCRGRGPTLQETMGWMKLGRPLLLGRCTVCKEDFWAWRRVEYCGRFKCFKVLLESRRRAC